MYAPALTGEDDDYFPWIVFDGKHICQTRSYEAEHETYMPLHEFILRGMGLWDEGPKVKVAGHDVVFNKGRVKIGCTKVTNDEVREVYKHLQD